MRRFANVAAIFTFSVGVWAQSISGRIAGTVTDASGGVVSKAAVRISNEGTGAERVLVSDPKGLFVASELPVGYYSVRISAPEFNEIERLHVKVDVGGETRVDASLSPKNL